MTPPVQPGALDDGAALEASGAYLVARATMSPVNAMKAAIRAYLASAAPPPPETWKLIDENTPSGVTVLLWKPSTQEQYVARKITGACGPGWCTPDGFEIFKATHWKPLDAPPPSNGEG